MNFDHLLLQPVLSLCLHLELLLM